MRRHSSSLISAGALAFSICVVVCAVAQEQPAAKKYLLKEAPAAVGDVSVTDRTNGFQMDVYGKPHGVEGAVPQNLPVSRRSREKFTETVLAVGKDGPTRVRRVYAIARRNDTPKPGLPAKVLVESRQSKTLTFVRAGGKITVTAATGKLTATETKSLAERFKPGSDVRTFPDHEVAIGDEWTIDNSAVGKLQGIGKMILKCRFLEIVPFQGRECAHLSIEVNMESNADRFPLIWAIKGDVYHAIDLQRILSVQMTGPVEMTGSLKSNDITIDLEGIGTGDIKMTQTWSKIAGKPLPAPKPPPAP